MGGSGENVRGSFSREKIGTVGLLSLSLKLADCQCENSPTIPKGLSSCLDALSCQQSPCFGFQGFSALTYIEWCLVERHCMKGCAACAAGVRTRASAWISRRDILYFRMCLNCHRNACIFYVHFQQSK